MAGCASHENRLAATPHPYPSPLPQGRGVGVRGRGSELLNLADDEIWISWDKTLSGAVNNKVKILQHDRAY